MKDFKTNNCRFCCDGIAIGNMKAHLKYCEYNTKEERSKLAKQQRKKREFKRVLKRGFILTGVIAIITSILGAIF